MTEITMIPVKNLDHSPLNVRTVDASSQGDRELLASIKAQGVLQNLVVHPAPRSRTRYLVAAGGRRLASLKLLLKQGEIDGGMLVPCQVKDEGAAIEASLAENVARENMHLADAVVAYGKLNKQGKTPKEIATLSGVPVAQVKRLLSLSGVSPKLLEAYKADKINLEAMQAFTLTDDQARQEEVFSALAASGRLYAHVIRDTMLGEAVRSTDRLARFVGAKAYRDAGGPISNDLFDSVSYWTDANLVMALAEKKAEQAAEALRAEGWKWVDVILDTTYAPHHLYAGSIEADRVGVPEALTAELAGVEKALADLNEMDMDEWTEEHDDQEQALAKRAEKLESEIEQYAAFTDEQRANAGAIVLVNHDGEAVATRGFLKKDDISPRSGSAETQGAGQSEEEDDAPLESAALRSDVAAYREHALQAHLVGQTKTCNDLLVFTLADLLLGDLSGRWGAVLNMNPTVNNRPAPDVEATRAADIKERARAALPVAWLAGESRAARYEAFKALTSKEKTALMAYCTAVTWQSNDDGMVELVGRETGFDLNDYWVPTAENYFSRLKIPALLAIGQREIGAEWVQAMKGQRKAAVVQALAEHPAMKGWQPSNVG